MTYDKNYNNNKKKIISLKIKNKKQIKINK
jgi:hypothetical protein